MSPLRFNVFTGELIGRDDENNNSEYLILIPGYDYPLYTFDHKYIGMMDSGTFIALPELNAKYEHMRI